MGCFPGDLVRLCLVDRDRGPPYLIPAWFQPAEEGVYPEPFAFPTPEDNALCGLLLGVHPASHSDRYPPCSVLDFQRRQIYTVDPSLTMVYVMHAERRYRLVLVRV